LLVLVIEIGKYFAFPINLFLVIMLGGITIPFISVWRRFLTYLSPKNKIKYSIPEVEDRILQILTEHKGKSLSRLDLVRKAKFPSNIKEFTEILNRLWQEEKIKREFQDYPKYSAI
jgi:hypothetical protein